MHECMYRAEMNMFPSISLRMRNALPVPMRRAIRYCRQMFSDGETVANIPSESSSLGIPKSPLDKMQSYHAWQAKEAEEVLQAITSQDKPLSKVDSARAEEYAKDVLGSLVYAPWLKVYTAMAGTFREGWIPDNYYGEFVLPRLNGTYGQLARLKAITPHLFDCNAFPDLLYFTNGLFIDQDGNALPDERVAEHLFSSHDKVVFKKEDSQRGLGVTVLRPDTLNLDAIRQIGNGVFQSFVRQHPDLAALSPSAAATLRLTTIISAEGSPTLRAAFLRVGRVGDPVVQQKSDVRISVIAASGDLDEIGYMPNWQSTTIHPDTGIMFVGKRMPGYDACVSLALDLHHRVRFVGCIGWDVSVDENDRVRVFEWNAMHNGIKFSEAVCGPCFSDLGWEKLHLKAETQL